MATLAAVDASACPAHIDMKSPTVTEAECPVSASSEDDDESPDENEEEIDHSKLLPIPSPPFQSYYGLLGHLPDLDRTLPVRSYWQFMDEYSPIFSLQLGVALPRVFVGNRELVDEMADDSRFIKYTHRLHQMMRPVFGDGLFSAESTSKAWGKAHRLLKPALGPIGLSKMFDDMQDISAQLVLKWDRMGDVEIECIKDMSSLTFDTIGLCAYGYRFNEFYSPDPHPFNTQLNEAIVESGRRANRPDLVNLWYYKEEAHRQENIVKMRALCSSIIQERIDNPKPDARDLLNVMINGIDKETGEQLGFENVMYQIPTLLGGGYETTTSTLCFIYYFMCNNPRTLLKAQQEVDEIVGDKVLQYDMIRNLKYLDACMKEALRLQHPVSLLTRFAVKDTVVGGKYLIKKGQMISGIWRHFHRDPKVWGEDADDFRPERMLDVNFSTLPENAWKPFGDGMRACIGRGFAEQEILINMAMVLQKFDMEKVDPAYELKLKGQMGVKPIDFKIRVRRRPGRGLMFGIPGGAQFQPEAAPAQQQSQKQQRSKHEVRRSISVLWGGNMGTTDSLVQTLSKYASDFGLDMEVQELDDAVEKLPTDKPVVIITPSYEGRPPDNAKKFVAWLEKLAAKKSQLPPGTKFAVFGVGNSDWVHTFHRVPRLIDDTLVALGCERILDVDFANVKRDLTGPWEAWSEKLCLTLSGTTKQELPENVGVDVEIASSASIATQTADGEQMTVGVVIASSELADASIGAPKRHVEIQLPEGCAYKSGDYLHVQGRNPDEAVSRVMKRFNLTSGDLMTVRSSKKDFLPARPVSIEHFLRSTVELASPITQRQLAILTTHAGEDGDITSKLKIMSNEAEYQQLLDKRYSIIDILEELPGLRLPFGIYIDLLLPLAPRPYSISSSPIHTADGSVASVTFDVFEAPATSGHGTFRGVASSYLANRSIGDSIQCLVRPTKLAFRLPVDPSTPIIMQAAGTGIAPMRAFLQERAALKRMSSVNFGPALLFFGCRHPDKDYLYSSELAAWEKEGIVEIIPCFSRPEGGAPGRYVADALWDHRDRIWDLFNSGAHVYTCGSAARLGRSSAATWRRILMEKEAKSEAESHEWLDEMRKDRYVSDVW